MEIIMAACGIEPKEKHARDWNITMVAQEAVVLCEGKAMGQSMVKFDVRLKDHGSCARGKDPREEGPMLAKAA